MRDFAHHVYISAITLFLRSISGIKPRRPDGFDEEYVKIRDFIQGRAFSVSNTQNLTFRPTIRRFYASVQG